MSSWRWPAAIGQNFYGATVPQMIGVLLPSSVTTIPGTWRTLLDVASSEIATGGGYIATGGHWSTTVGVQFPDLRTVYDDTAGIVEVGHTAALLSSTNVVTVSFRWIVYASGQNIINIVDYGSQSIQEQPLVLTLQQSPDIAGSYPIQRAHRTS